MSQKKPYLVKASLVNKVAKTKGKIFSVIAAVSTDNLNLKKIETATFGCKQCKTQFAAIAGTEPFCVTCSSSEVDEIKKVPFENLAKIKESELAGVECKNCHTHNVISMETAHLLDTKMHCVQCGTEIEYSLDDDDEALEDDDVVVDDTTFDPEEMESEEEIEDDETDFTETSELNENDHIGTDAPENKTNVDTALDGEKVKLPGVTEQEENKQPVESNTFENEDDVENTELTDQGVGGEGLDIDSEEVDLIDVVEGSLSFERVGQKIVATINNVPVAVLHKEKAVENAGVFNSNSFINAINFEATRNGSSAQKALASFNFDFTKVKIPLPNILNTRVEAKVKECASTYETKAKTLSEDFQQCIALAAVALNKGSLKGKVNTLKASFVENLRSCGVRNPEKLVSSIFKQHSEDYHKLLIETANNFMAKSLDARNELAEMLGEVNPVDDLDEEMMDDEYEDDNILESRLERASVTAKTKPVQKVKSIPETSSVSIAVSSIKEMNGGRLF